MKLQVLETIRLLEADLENCRTSVAQQMLLTITNERHRVLRDHFYVAQAARAAKLVRSLEELYEDDDLYLAQDAHEDEATMMEELHKELSYQREYHRIHKIASVERVLPRPDPQLLNSLFSRHESFGGRMDLREAFNLFTTFTANSTADDDASSNNKGSSSSFQRSVTLTKFLQDLPVMILSKISFEQKVKQLGAYFAFVKSLHEYLVDFHRRVFPLQHKKVCVALADVERRYLNAQTTQSSTSAVFPVWFMTSPLLAKAEAAQNIDRTQTTATVVQECQILYLLQHELALHLKATEQYVIRSASKSIEELTKHDEEENLDFVISFRKGLETTKTNTVDQIAQSEVEDDLGRALGAEEAKDDGEDDDEDKQEGVLLGEDNEPIERWLIQMQQLDKSFLCAVCSYTFRGPKMYHDHFLQDRHIEALRRIGVGYKDVALFYGIQTIEGVYDCLRLLRERRSNGIGRSFMKRVREDVLDEEVEDYKGQKMTRKAVQHLMDMKQAL